jgi:hypothetical protein
MPMEMEIPAVAPVAASAKPRKPWQTWTRRALGAIITLAIFVGMLRPVYQKWGDVHAHLAESISWPFFAGAAMFAFFLFVFRVISWRQIMIGLGHRLPVAASTRIWSTSELARYLPGVIWQVVGRVYLVRPYGVSGSVCSASQVLELSIFLLANIILAILCLLYYGVRNMGQEARPYLFAIMAVVPVLTLLLRPKFFYGVLNRVMARLKKPPMSRQVGYATLVRLLVWAMLGLLWQSLAVWLVTRQALGGLPLTKWWVVAGSYCLAWCCGFLAFWAPGGLGVRELVFVFAMQYALPPWFVKEHLADPVARLGLLGLLSIVLRLWTITGELILTTIAYSLDFRGALGHPDAPGRVKAM